MKIASFALCLLLAGCITPKSPVALPEREVCPALPLLPETPTAAQREAWTKTVIAMYVRCAKGQK
jgi:hypothetical protein